MKRQVVSPFNIREKEVMFSKTPWLGQCSLTSSYKTAEMAPTPSYLKIVQDLVLIFLYIPLGIISRIYDFVVMNSLLGWQRSKQDHAKLVAKIQEQVRQWKKEKSGMKMCTSRPGWRSISMYKTNKSRFFQVSVPLDKVIEIDEKKKELTVEPGLMMGQLTRILVPRGWTIPVVPELDTLTVGGLVAGCGLESSSHKYGLFFDVVLSYEIVLPDSTVVKCSKDNNPDLFYSIPGSYGTLGFITAVTFPLIPATPYIDISYHYCDSVSSVKKLILDEGVKHEFVEGFAYSEKDFVLMFGDFATGPTPSQKINRINRFYKPFFHVHAEDIMNKLKKGNLKAQEFIPTIDYYHRHSKGVFWILESALSVYLYKPTMLLFGWQLPVNTHLQVIAPGLVDMGQKMLVVQDYVVPFEEFENFFLKGCKDFQTWPIWICPTKSIEAPNMYQKPDSPRSGLNVDLGFYGNFPGNWKKTELMGKYEKLCIDCKGFQGLYADVYMSEKMLEQMFDFTSYNKVRKEIGADKAFPTIYEKISPVARRLKNE